MTSPEADLVFAILRGAVEDALGRVIVGVSDPKAQEMHQREGILFCCAEIGQWRESRAHLCSLVDIEPDVLRTNVLRQARNLGLADLFDDVLNPKPKPKPKPKDTIDDLLRLDEARRDRTPAPPKPRPPDPKIDAIIEFVARSNKPLVCSDIAEALGFGIDVTRVRLRKLADDGVLIRHEEKRRELFEMGPSSLVESRAA